MPSMEEQLARFIHMSKVNGMSAEKLAEELSAKFEIPLARAKATVEKRADGYRIVFSVAEKDLGLAAPLAGRAAKGDFGVTFGDAAGKDTVLRTFRFDKAAGIVSDEVEELKIHPENWGEIRF